MSTDPEYLSRFVLTMHRHAWQKTFLKVFQIQKFNARKPDLSNSLCVR